MSAGERIKTTLSRQKIAEEKDQYETYKQLWKCPKCGKNTPRRYVYKGKIIYGHPGRRSSFSVCGDGGKTNSPTTYCEVKRDK